MTTRADDLRAAAKLLDDDVWLAGKLLAHADAIERVEREMRLEAGNYDEPEQLMNDLVSWAAALRGETK